MVCVIVKTNIVRQIGHCQGAARTSTAAEIMMKFVTFCNATDGLAEMLPMMLARGLVHVPIANA